MKTARSLSVVLLLLAACCAGSRAREHVLFPLVVSTWPAVLSDVDRSESGQAADVVRAAATVDEAIAADDWTQLRGVDAEVLRTAAIAGVEDRVDRGEISRGVADSLLERVDQFTRTLRELSR